MVRKGRVDLNYRYSVCRWGHIDYDQSRLVGDDGLIWRHIFFLANGYDCETCMHAAN